MKNDKRSLIVWLFAILALQYVIHRGNDGMWIQMWK
jgi:hypothetical protein